MNPTISFFTKLIDGTFTYYVFIPNNPKSAYFIHTYNSLFIEKIEGVQLILKTSKINGKDKYSFDIKLNSMNNDCPYTAHPCHSLEEANLFLENHFNKFENYSSSQILFMLENKIRPNLQAANNFYMRFLQEEQQIIRQSQQQIKAAEIETKNFIDNVFTPLIDLTDPVFPEN